jgi:hypothetical protein
MKMALVFYFPLFCNIKKVMWEGHILSSHSSVCGTSYESEDGHRDTPLQLEAAQHLREG